MPRAPERTGWQSVVPPVRPKGRTPVFGQDGGPYRVRNVTSGKVGGGRPETVGDGTNDVA